MATGRFQQGNVLFDGTGVFFQICRVVELRGVYEDTTDDDIRMRFGEFNERQMTLMQGAHRWNQRGRLPNLTKTIQGVLKVDFSAKNFHRQNLKNKAQKWEKNFEY